MKVFRGPKSTNTWAQTDAQAIGEWASKWTPESIYQLDGTIDKSGVRHTAIGFQFEPADVLSLLGGMLSYYQNECQRQRTSRAELAELVERLEEGFDDLISLVTVEKSQAPSQDALLDAVEALARHYYISPKENAPRQPWQKSRSDAEE